MSEPYDNEPDHEFDESPVRKPVGEHIMARMFQEIRHREEISAMTDGELAKEMIREVWAILPLWTRPAVLIDEAITRLKKADTRRRWQERKERRALKV